MLSKASPLVDFTLIPDQERGQATLPNPELNLREIEIIS